MNILDLKRKQYNRNYTKIFGVDYEKKSIEESVVKKEDSEMNRYLRLKRRAGKWVEGARKRKEIAILEQEKKEQEEKERIEREQRMIEESNANIDLLNELLVEIELMGRDFRD